MQLSQPQNDILILAKITSAFAVLEERSAGIIERLNHTVDQKTQYFTLCETDFHGFEDIYQILGHRTVCNSAQNVTTEDENRVFGIVWSSWFSYAEFTTQGNVTVHKEPKNIPRGQIQKSITYKTTPTENLKTLILI